MKKKKIEKVTFKTPEERKAQLHKTMNEMNKNLGMNVIRFGKDVKDYQRIPFGIPEIDEMFGGGIVRGLFTTLWGQAGSGKTTLAYYLTAQAQMLGLNVLFIALEPFDKERATSLGVDLDKLYLANFPQAEQALDAIVDLSDKKLIDLVILDSIHSLSPKGEQEDRKGVKKSLDTDTMALLARKLSQFFRVAIDPVRRNEVAVLLIGQTRTDLGGFIALQKLSGGNALHHHSKLIAYMRRGQKADAPVKKEKIETFDSEGMPKKKTVTTIIGFDSVIKIQKTQISGTKDEGYTIHLPYYYKTAYDEQPSARGKLTFILPAGNERVYEDITGLKLDNKEEPSKKKGRGRPKKETK